MGQNVNVSLVPDAPCLIADDASCSVSKCRIVNDFIYHRMSSSQMKQRHNMEFPGMKIANSDAM